jgi:hypothetical protein
MESQKQFEELDDRAYTESFDDVMTICPRPGMTAQERYEFRKKNKPSLTRGNQDGLSRKEFEDLIARLSRLKKETPSAPVLFQDVKDILQDKGLLEALLKEHVSDRIRAMEAVEQKNKKKRSLLTKRFATLSVALSSLFGFSGYLIGNQLANEENKAIEIRVGNLEKYIYGEPRPASLSVRANTEFDSSSVILQGCNRSNKAVKCSVNIVSKIDQSISVGSCIRDTRTRFFDPQGIEHKANVVEFGNRFDRSGCTVEKLLIKDVPAKATLTFNDVALETKSMKALEISIGIKSNKGTEWQYPQYREVIIK